jgi:hypothetical protein
MRSGCELQSVAPSLAITNGDQKKNATAPGAKLFTFAHL